MVFSRFDKDQEMNIHRHCWKELLGIRKRTRAGFPFVRTDLYRPAHSHRNEISLLSNNSNSFVIVLVHISS